MALIMPAHNVTLSALWTSSPTYYTVTYSGSGNNGGNAPTGTPASYEWGQTVTVPGNTGNFTRTGFSFAGWNTVVDGTGTSYVQGDTFTMGNKPITLYAQWTLLPIVMIYFDSQGGTAVGPRSMYVGSKVVEPNPHPTKSGYSFAGWYKEATCTNAWNFSSDVVPDVTLNLFAKWMHL
jgi:uncharacterized repeat protein (TIGR02543 family)